MKKPTGQPYRNWKKAELRRLARVGEPRPDDWPAHWEKVQGDFARNQEASSDQLRILRVECSRLRAEAITHRSVRREILRLTEVTPPAPDWLLGTKGKPPKHRSVPTLLATDWHWGERVDPGQVGGVNAYSLEIARARARRLIHRTVAMLKHHMKYPDYPGIVFALGGDMFSGDIHEELSRSNESPIMQVVLDLYGVLIWCVETLADEFGRVFIPAVAGNHSRITQKPFAKDRAKLNFDWLVYCLLEKHFKDDDRIQFCIPEGPDASYRIYGHDYCLTHGDQFRGGDGMVGALGPILRGDHKKRSRNGQISAGYSSLILGHWHQSLNLGRVIVGGSLIGYNEYAFNANFPFEVPQQSLWLTHPEHGITFFMNIRVDDFPGDYASSWVSWPSSDKIGE